MSVSNGQDANQSTFNDAFISRTSNSSTTGKLDLKNTNTSSGSNVTNIQREMNGSASFTGRSLNGSKSEKPSWNDNSVGTSSDDLKDRADALTTEVASLSGAPQWVKETFSYTDFSTSSTTNDISLFSLGATSIIHAYIVEVSTAFSGGSISDYVLRVGLSGDKDKHIYDVDVTSTGANSYQLLIFEDLSSSTDIRIEAESTGDNLDQATQGSVNIYRLVSTLP